VQLLFDFSIPQPVVARAAPASPPTRARSVLQPGGPAASRALVRVRNPRGINHARPIQQRYDEVVELMLAKYELNVRRWRNSLSGLATLRIFRDGRHERWLESPYPTSPLRMAIFLHEVGHHAIGLGVHRPRCKEELMAWHWSVRHMEALGFATKGVVARRMFRSMQHEVRKATRKGIKGLPAELMPFAPAHLIAATSASHTISIASPNE
jgi:hypothetical protein